MFKPDLAQANLEHASSTNSKCKPTITIMMVEPSLNNIIHLKKVATIELKLTYDKNKTKKNCHINKAAIHNSRAKCSGHGCIKPGINIRPQRQHFLQNSARNHQRHHSSFKSRDARQTKKMTIEISRNSGDLRRQSSDNAVQKKGGGPGSDPFNFVDAQTRS